MMDQPKIHAKKPKPAFTPKRTDHRIYDFTDAELADNIENPRWRLANLYSILGANSQIIPFVPNGAQKFLLDNMAHRSVVLKCRKLGFSTCIQLLMLDTCLFSGNERGKVIAQDLGVSEAIFRDTLKLAYKNLPEPFKQLLPVDGEPSKTSIAFKNGSIVEVSTNARGTSPSILHVSELARIAKENPGKSREIITGTITAVPPDGLVFVESTADGQEGDFYDLVQTAIKLKESGKPLWKYHFKFFFYGWYENPMYVAPADSVVISDRDKAYFDRLEVELNKVITPEQRAWYVSFRDNTYMGDVEKMWAEQPSSPQEAFKLSTEGAYFAEQFTRIRKEDRITKVPYDPSYPVNLFFDLGANDETAIWFIQAKRGQMAVIDFFEANGEPLSYFVNEVDKKNYTMGYVYLPHDANHRRQGQDRNLTPEEMLQELAPHWRFMLVPRTPDKLIAIQQTRNMLPICVFDEEKCKEGLIHLELYRKTWDSRKGMWRSTPNHDSHSNAADAFLQAAQAKAMNLFGYGNAGYSLGGAFGNDFGGGFTPEPNLDY